MALSQLQREELESKLSELKELFFVLSNKYNAINTYYSNILTKSYTYDETKKKQQEEEKRATLPKQGNNKGCIKKSNVKNPSSDKGKRKSRT